MLEWAVDGSDGAAKSPILSRLRRRLEEAGIRVEVRAPFALANVRRVTRLAEALGKAPEDLSAKERFMADIYFLWADVLDGCPTAIGLLSDVIAQGRAEAKAAGAQVLLWDRHWLTVMGEIYLWPHLVASWGNDCPDLFLLWAPPSQTRSSRRFSEGVPWTRSDETMTKHNERFTELCNGPFRKHVVERFEVCERSQDLGPIVDAMFDHIRARV